MLTDQEFAGLLADPTKEIIGDIPWTASPSHPGAHEFTARVRSQSDWPLRVEAWRNPHLARLSYSVIYEGVGRIVGLCLGVKVHHLPDCHDTRAGKRHCACPRGTHKHRWTEQFADQWLYAPSDITADVTDPTAVWRQFCAEIDVSHLGTLVEPEGNEPW